MSEQFGRRIWVIPEGFIPADDGTSSTNLTSHDVACILNPNDSPADIQVTIYYHDRDPAGPYQLSIPARRTTHLNFNELKDPEPIPRDTAYSSVIYSTVPIVVQYSRLDLRQPPHAVASAMAWSESM